MSAETTAKKQQIGIPFKPGQSGNPKGRPKGSRNKLGEDFISALHDDFQEHGTQAIQDVRETKPDAYLKVIASILPKDLNINVNKFDELSDDELIARLRELDATIRPFLSGQGDGRDTAGAEEATKH